MHFQTLLKKKAKLANLELQFNSLLSKIQIKGILPETPKELNSLSFHFINFGVKLLNIGIEFNHNNMLDNSGIKVAINNLIKNLKEISSNIPNTNDINQRTIDTNSSIEEIEKYNVKFETSNKDIDKLIVCNPHITLDELIKEFLLEIDRKDLFDIEEKEILFYYNGEIINNKEKKSIKLIELFKKINNPLIFLFFLQN